MWQLVRGFPWISHGILRSGNFWLDLAWALVRNGFYDICVFVFVHFYLFGTLYMIGGRGLQQVPSPQWYGQDPWRRLGRPNLTKIKVWAPGGAETLRMQRLWRPEAPKPCKYYRFSVMGAPGRSGARRTRTHARAHAHTRTHHSTTSSRGGAGQNTHARTHAQTLTHHNPTDPQGEDGDHTTFKTP